MISAGIVLYNPNISRLKESIKAVENQVDEIILFDNGSNNIKEVKKLLCSKSRIKLIDGGKNSGIANALNRIAIQAIKDSNKWLLTLDQDSVVNDNLIEVYKKYMKLPRVGQLSCLYRDRNRDKKRIYGNKRGIYGNNKVIKSKYAITSGSLINLAALREVGGFDSSFFIDWVDMEICCALRAKNYETYQLNYVGFLHELGNPTSFHFLGLKGYTSNYPAFRYYYGARNSIEVALRYPKEENLFVRLLIQLKLVGKINLYEKNKIKKSKAIFKGIKDGIKNRKLVRKDYINL